MTGAGSEVLEKLRRYVLTLTKFMTTTPTGLVSLNSPVGSGTGMGYISMSPEASGLASHRSVWVVGIQSTSSVYSRETRPEAGPWTTVPLGRVMVPLPLSWKKTRGVSRTMVPSGGYK